MSCSVPPRRTVMNLGSRFFGKIIRLFFRVPFAQRPVVGGANDDRRNRIVLKMARQDDLRKVFF